ncbi:MAG: hypothetical protein F9K21_12435 [Rhodocyclaceae bacterium]|nr:MAG: hypothetical protein F9K21_12435 [Rhodocyclaceae bacterium]
MPMGLRRMFANPDFYLGWAFYSGMGLVAAWFMEPYLFAYAAIGALVVSILLAVVSITVSIRSRPGDIWLGLAGFAGMLPGAVAMLILHSLSWA